MYPQPPPYARPPGPRPQIPEPCKSTKYLQPPSHSNNHTTCNDLSTIVYDVQNTENFEFGRYWELEQGSGQIVDVQGRVKAKPKFWEEVLKAPVPVREWVTEGYKLPFLSMPQPYFRVNQRSAHENAVFVSSVISDLQVC